MSDRELEVLTGLMWGLVISLLVVIPGMLLLCILFDCRI